MKKLLLIPALLAGTLLLAKQKLIEISPMLGYNLAEGNFNIKDDGYPLIGLEFQLNTKDAQISPEFSFFYAQGVTDESGRDTDVLRGAVNGVYTFNQMSYFIPFAKVGAGFEKIGIQNRSLDNNFFLDTGAGVKIPFTSYAAFKLEATYLAKIARRNKGMLNSNLVTMVGIAFTFGDEAKSNSPIERPTYSSEQEPEPAPVVVETIDGDDDNDTVLNSKDECPATPVGAKVDKNGCEVDSDNDGVLNVKDECPATPIGIKVDKNGCDIDKDKDGVLNVKDKCPATPIGTKVDASGCYIDMDHDGILNVNDICPNTLPNTAVNSDGCPQMMPLNITFEKNSDKIKPESKSFLKTYAKFLIKYTNYSAVITGYTDDRGSASYNLKLSEKRAATVLHTLIAQGVNPKQLKSKGAGETNPIADNKTSKGRAKNRRIEAELTRH